MAQDLLIALQMSAPNAVSFTAYIEINSVTTTKLSYKCQYVTDPCQLSTIIQYRAVFECLNCTI